MLAQVQRRAARYTFNVYHNTSKINEMLENQNWLTLQERSEKTRLQLFHKIINNDLARPSQYLLIKSLSETRYTRQKTYI